MGDESAEQFATGGIVAPNGGRYAFVEPASPPPFVILRGSPERSEAILRQAARWYGLLSGPGDHFWRIEMGTWRCNDCESDCTAGALCGCCGRTT